MKLEEMKSMSHEELLGACERLERELFEIRLQNETQQLSNPARLREARKAVARAKTLLRQHELGQQPPETEEA